MKTSDSVGMSPNCFCKVLITAKYFRWPSVGRLRERTTDYVSGPLEDISNNKAKKYDRMIFLTTGEDHGSHEISSFGCSDNEECLENNDNRTGIEVLEVNAESTISHARLGIAITLFVWFITFGSSIP
ncbi:hypothetical protein VNO77_43661 [Canavalia gladiata]|uniref:Uncharacterized protein n=1 Tax=Canavalia gladiata TaxID=3824 RepID=A0AAN9PPM4_CANGL